MDSDRYKLILEFATEGFWDWNLKADRAFLSPRYCEMTGYSPDDTVFDTAFLRKIIYPDDQQRVFQVFVEYLQGKRASSAVEHRIVTKDGNTRWVEARGNIVEHDEQGRPSRMVGTITDITERKLAEIERGQYFNFFTSSSELMCIAGLDGYFKKTNPSFSRTLGYAEQELLARPLIEFIHPDDRQTTADEIARQLLTFAKGNQPITKSLSIKHLVEESASFVLRGTKIVNNIDIPENIRAIKADEGQISVHSMVGEGTTFEIVLPASHEEIAVVAQETASWEQGANLDKTILVMDDEEIIRDVLSMMLTDLGYHVAVCVNGDEAVELYRSSMKLGSPFSAAIMDLTIPGGMGGKEAAHHIINIDPHARLIVSSGYSSDSTMSEYTDFGFKATLHKPYSIEEIMKTLGSVLSVA